MQLNESKDKLYIEKRSDRIVIVIRRIMLKYIIYLILYIICLARVEIAIVITFAGLTWSGCELISSILDLCMGLLPHRNFALLSVPKFTANLYCICLSIYLYIYLSRCSAYLRTNLGHTVFKFH